MAAPVWHDTTALPAGATRAAFEACPAVSPNGHHGPDPDEDATDRLLEDAHDGGWWLAELHDLVLGAHLQAGRGVTDAIAAADQAAQDYRMGVLQP